MQPSQAMGDVKGFGSSEHLKRLDELRVEIDALRQHIDAARGEAENRRNQPDRRRAPRPGSADRRRLGGREKGPW